MSGVATHCVHAHEQLADYLWQNPTTSNFEDGKRVFQINGTKYNRALKVRVISKPRSLADLIYAAFHALLSMHNREVFSHTLHNNGITAASNRSEHSSQCVTLKAKYKEGVTINPSYNSNLHQFFIEQPQLAKEAKKHVDRLKDVPHSPLWYCYNCPIKGIELNGTNAVVMEHNGEAIVVSREGIRSQLLNNNLKQSKISRDMIMRSEFKQFTYDLCPKHGFLEYLADYPTFRKTFDEKPKQQ
ncbi:hypothetical protein D5018_09365 [Parashewanella curva]|uniref:Uncharacterized protein n=1 Tax=Parashewanella curva TaxID=2338552 RepID=A0A3L8PZN8_9GAMM|nr:hypothetical protein [Parashewanella curva]RLV60003.1 hypothetical protein D5018_09365 [Parashewanella curva]